MAQLPAHAAPGFLHRRTWPVLAGAALLAGLVASGVSGHGPVRPAVAAEPPGAHLGTVSAVPAVSAVADPPAIAASTPSTSAARSRRAGPSTHARSAVDGAPAAALAADGIPSTALAAYRAAAAREATLRPDCGLPWTLLAAIGRVESDHGRFAGAVLHVDGLSTPAVVGIPLDGHGTALIRDTDHGRLDGDRVYDRAVGPMQFIPSTWASWGVDGNGDGVRDPFNIRDAAPAAADYLCAAGGDLRTWDGQVQAVLSYNHSDAYVAEVLGLEKVYAAGAPGVTYPTPPAAGGTGSHPHVPTLPPVDPAPRSTAAPTQPSTSASTSASTSKAAPSTGSSSAAATSSASPSSAATSGAATSTGPAACPSTATTEPSGSPGATSSGPTAPGTTCPSPAASTPVTSGTTGTNTAAATTAAGISRTAG